MSLPPLHNDYRKKNNNNNNSKNNKTNKTNPPAYIIIAIALITNTPANFNPFSTALIVGVGASSSNTDQMQKFHFKIISNICMNTADSGLTTNVRNLMHCVLDCLKHEHCLSVTFNTDTKTCHASTFTMSSVAAVVDFGEACKYTEITERTTNDWQLAFRATAGIGLGVYETWNNVGHTDDDVTAVTSDSIGCLTVDGRLLCDKHVRSWRLDDWNNIVEVKHAFYSDSQEVFYVTFDASGTSHRDQHFVLSRVLASSVSQLVGYNGAYDYQSIEGYINCRRRFYLNRDLVHCGADYGWMMISDHEGTNLGCCAYESTAPFPYFWYSPYTNDVNWAANDKGSAQVFAVFVKYNPS